MKNLSINIFKDGTKIIKKSDLDKINEIVVIPRSVKEIEEDAFYGLGCTVIYTGTTTEFDEINTYDKICAPCVYCVDGLKILAL